MLLEGGWGNEADSYTYMFMFLLPFCGPIKCYRSSWLALLSDWRITDSPLPFGGGILY